MSNSYFLKKLLCFRLDSAAAEKNRSRQTGLPVRQHGIQRFFCRLPAFGQPGGQSLPDLRKLNLVGGKKIIDSSGLIIKPRVKLTRIRSLFRLFHCQLRPEANTGQRGIRIRPQTLGPHMFQSAVLNPYYGSHTAGCLSHALYPGLDPEDTAASCLFPVAAIQPSGQSVFTFHGKQQGQKQNAAAHQNQ